MPADAGRSGQGRRPDVLEAWTPEVWAAGQAVRTHRLAALVHSDAGSAPSDSQSQLCAALQYRCCCCCMRLRLRAEWYRASCTARCAAARLQPRRTMFPVYHAHSGTLSPRGLTVVSPRSGRLLGNRVADLRSMPACHPPDARGSAERHHPAPPAGLRQCRRSSCSAPIPPFLPQVPDRRLHGGLAHAAFAAALRGPNAARGLADRRWRGADDIWRWLCKHAVGCARSLPQGGGCARSADGALWTEVYGWEPCWRRHVAWDEIQRLVVRRQARRHCLARAVAVF
jgi:hypothetical protein